MTDELVKRLRYLSRVFRKHDVEELTYNDYLSARLYPDEAADRIEALTAERDKYESACMTAEGRLADAMEGLEKCQAELDEYSRQEYPLDHSVHERYRQRDYDANPARITLAALKGESHD